MSTEVAAKENNGVLELPDDNPWMILIFKEKEQNAYFLVVSDDSPRATVVTKNRYHYNNINRWTALAASFPFVVMAIYFAVCRDPGKSLMSDFAVFFVWGVVGAALTKLRKPCPEPKAVFYRNDDDIILLKRLPRNNLTNPDDLVKAMHRIMAADVNAHGFLELLKDDHYAPDVVELIRTVASTENPDTLATVRKAVEEIWEGREAKRKAERLQRQAEVERRKEEHRQLLEAQPDYSNDIAELVRHREEQLA